MVFTPSKHGFKFVNDPPNSSLLFLGNTNNGLCGGMVFTVLDFFNTNTPIPSLTEFPEENTYLFEYIKNRFLDSLRLLVGGGLKVAWWSAFSRIQDTWNNLNSFKEFPIPIILIKVKTLNPFKLGHNHQVLIYDCKINEDKLKIYGIYDPNYPNNDNIVLECTPNSIKHTYYGKIYGFYKNKYTQGTIPSELCQE